MRLTAISMHQLPRILYLPEVVAMIMLYANKYHLPKMNLSFTSMPSDGRTLYAFTKHSIDSTTII